MSRWAFGPNANMVTPEVDVSGARIAGMWALWRRDSAPAGTVEADAIIDELRDLPSLLGLGRHDGTTSEPCTKADTQGRKNPVVRIGNRRIAKSVKLRHSRADHDPPPGGLVAVTNQASQRDEPA